MIVQNISQDGHTDMTFTISRKDLPQTLELMTEVARKTGASEVLHDVSVAKVSAIGVGMRNHSGVAARAVAALTQEGINIPMISTGNQDHHPDSESTWNRPCGFYTTPSG